MKREWLWLSVMTLPLMLQAASWGEHSLRANMVHRYDGETESVDTFGEMFSGGKFYGRLRFNSFGFQWKEELTRNGKDIRKDHAIAAVGGSLIYKSARLNGFSFGAGVYGSAAEGSLSRRQAYLYKAGKGVFSRYDRLTDGTSGMLSLTQAYLAYRYSRTELKAGRQLFESFLTKSNDTKMIPNAFEGVTVTSRDLPDTVLKAAYLTRQKLRDHSEFHHVAAYGKVPGAPLDTFTQYSENDDSSMHIGLTTSRLAAHGIDDRLVVVEAKNRSFDHLSLYANYTGVPDLFSSAMIQADYTATLGGWKIKPGLRYMRQFDDGAGEVIGSNGASRRLITVGYKDPDSLDSWLIGARLDVAKENLHFRLGYTKVGDKADIIAPWRGFPTSGFTRAMSQYNWYANTESYMLQVKYDTAWLGDLSFLGRFVYEDFDDSKPGVQADAKVFTLDVMRGFGKRSHLYTKLRYGHVWGEDDTPIAGSPGRFKLDPSYDEIRFEINYLF
jgi:hypothetical protein